MSAKLSCLRHYAFFGLCLAALLLWALVSMAQVGNPVPTITSISPDSAPAGSGYLSLTVNGSGFNAASKIRWNGTDQYTTFVSSTQLRASSIQSSDLATAGTAQVTVYNPPTGGGTSNAVTFTIAANPVPAITSISPDSAPAGSGYLSLTVNGSGFNAASKIRWNGTDQFTTFVSSTQLRTSIWSDALTAAGTAQVTVYNPGAAPSNAVTFTITANPVPAITSISPDNAAAGSGFLSLAVNGTGFTAASKVRWNDTDQSTTFVSATQLRAYISSDALTAAGTAQVTVYNPGAGSSNGVTFTITANPAPAITSISPDSAPAGSGYLSLTVNGSGFNAASKIRWNGTDQYTTFVSSTQLRASSIQSSDLATAGTAQVTVYNPPTGGGTSNAVTFTITANPVPAITSISPDSAPAGSGYLSLTVNGSAFNAASKIRWNGTDQSTTFVSSTQLRTSIWSDALTAAGTAQVTVYNPGAAPSNAVTFTITANPAPAILSISPSSAPPGSGSFSLTVNGAGFNAASKIRWNGTDQYTTFVNATQLRAYIGSDALTAAGTAKITVYNPPTGGGASNAVTFTISGVGNPVPAITSISPNSFAAGSASFTLTVSGSGFVSSSVVRWNGGDRMTTLVSDAQLQAAISAADIATAGTVQVTVFNPPADGGTSNAVAFTISSGSPAAPIASLSPASASPGGGAFTLTVIGANFVSGSVVRWNGSDRATVFVSSTELRASISAADIAVAGAAQVTVVSPGGGVSNALTFAISACSYSIAPTSQSFPAGGGTGSVAVTAAANCAWTASSNSGWVTVSSGGSGSGTGTVNYSVAANTSSDSRTGTLTIASLTFTVTEGGAGTLSVSSGSLTFTAPRGGANPPSQTVQVTASGGSAISWTATVLTGSGGNWLSISPASGTTPGSASVVVNVAGLAAGTYTGQVSIAASGGAPTIVSVSLNVGDVAPVIGVSPASLQFTTSVGTNPAAQNITVSNQGVGTLSWLGTVSYTSGSGWLSLAPPGGNAPTTASVSIDVVTPGLPAGTYRGQIMIAALSGATNSPLGLPVTLVVTSPAQLAVAPRFLNFQVTQGGVATSSQAVSITNAGSGTLNWTAAPFTSDGGTWLALSLTQGTTPATLTISANPAGLKAGVYLGTVQIADPAARQTVPVTVALTVNPPATTILLSQSDVVFTTAENASTTLKQTLRVLNIGQGTLNWRILATIPSGGNWLSIDQASGFTTTDPATAAPVGVLVNPGGLPAGNYYGLVIAAAPGATNSPQLVSVHLRVVPPTSTPVAAVLPSGFIFAVAEAGASPAAQAFSVQNVGGGTLPFGVKTSTSDGVAWLSASPPQATAPATISVPVNSGTLRAGVYRGAVQLEFPGGGTQDLSVILLVTPAGAAVPAFARWDQPMVGCAPTELHAVSTALPNNFTSLVGWPVPIVVRVVDNCNNAVTAATVVATFLGTGDTPLVLKSLRDGLYTGTWVPLSNQRVRISIKALQPPLREAGIELLGQPSNFDAALPLINPGGVVNGASFVPQAPVAPGSIISLFGRQFLAENLQASLPLPRKLGGLAVKIGDLDVPLFFAGPGQVNAQVPFELSTNTAASVVVTLNGKVSPPESLLISSAHPGVFSCEKDGIVRGAILDEAYKPVTPSNPTPGAKVIQVFATGLGPTDPAVGTGALAPASPPARLVPSTQVEAMIGGIPAQVSFAGLAPNFVGLYQVNVTVPAGLPSGDLPLVLIVNGIRSNEVMLAVK